MLKLERKKKTKTERIKLCFSKRLGREIDGLTEDLVDHYEVFRIRKRGKGFRKICKPDPQLKRVQREVLKKLKKAGIEEKLSQYSHGFSTHRSIGSNAVAHARPLGGAKMEEIVLKLGLDERQLRAPCWYGKTRVVNKTTKIVDLGLCQTGLDVAVMREGSIKSGLRMDFKDAFGTVTRGMVFEAVNRVIEFTNPVDYDRLTDLCMLDGSLPQGSPLSPLMLNLVLAGFDKYLMAMLVSKVAVPHKCSIRYTRFADDMIITSTQKGAATRCIGVVRGVANHHGFRINEKKTRVMSRSNGIFATGINLVNSATHYGVSRRARGQIRAAIYQASLMSGDERSKAKEKVMGRIAHVNSIDPVHGTVLFGYAYEKGLVTEDDRLHNLTLGEKLRATHKRKKNRHQLYTEGCIKPDLVL